MGDADGASDQDRRDLESAVEAAIAEGRPFDAKQWWTQRGRSDDRPRLPAARLAAILAGLHLLSRPRRPIELFNLRLTGTLDLRSVTLDESLVLEGLELLPDDGGAPGPGIDLRDARLQSLSLRRARAAWLCARQAAFDGSLDLRDADLGTNGTSCPAGRKGPADEHDPADFARLDLVAVEIAGDLLLDRLRLGPPRLAKSTHGIAGLDAEGAAVEGSVTLRQFAYAHHVRLRNMRVGEDLDLGASTFGRHRRFQNPGEPGCASAVELDCDQIEVRDSLYLGDKRIRAPEDREPPGAASGGWPKSYGIRLYGRLSLLGARIGGDLCLSESRILAGTAAVSPRGPDERLGPRKHPDKLAVHANGLEVGRSAFFDRGFQARGEVRLRRARIGGRLDFTEACLSNRKGAALNADAVEVGRSLYLRGRRKDLDGPRTDERPGQRSRNGFRAYGLVRLVRAKIGGNLRIRNAALFGQRKPTPSYEGFPELYQDALKAELIEVGGHLQITGGVLARGRVSLSRAQIGGHFQCWDAAVETQGSTSFSMAGLRVRGNLFLGRVSNRRSGREADTTLVHCCGMVRLRGAEIGGNAVFAGAFWSFEHIRRWAERGYGTKLASSIERAPDLTPAVRGGFDPSGDPIDAALQATRLSLGGSLFLSERSVFWGAVYLRVAKVGAFVNANGACIVNGIERTPREEADGDVTPPTLAAEDAEIGGHLDLMYRKIGDKRSDEPLPLKPFVSVGCVYLNRTRIGGLLSARGGLFLAPYRQDGGAGAEGPDWQALFCEECWGRAAQDGHPPPAQRLPAAPPFQIPGEDFVRGLSSALDLWALKVGPSPTPESPKSWYRSMVPQFGREVTAKLAEPPEQVRAIDAGGVEIEGHLELSDGFRAYGAVRFRRARIRGEASCRRGLFLGSLQRREARLKLGDEEEASEAGGRNGGTAAEGRAFPLVALELGESEIGGSLFLMSAAVFGRLGLESARIARNVQFVGGRTSIDAIPGYADGAAFSLTALRNAVLSAVWPSRELAALALFWLDDRERGNGAQSYGFAAIDVALNQAVSEEERWESVAAAQGLDQPTESENSMAACLRRLWSDAQRSDTDFDEAIAGAGLSVANSVNADRALVFGRIQLRRARIGGSLRCYGGLWIGNMQGICLDAKQAEIGRDLRLLTYRRKDLQIRTEAVGSVLLDNAGIGGDLRITARIGTCSLGPDAKAETRDGSVTYAAGGPREAAVLSAEKVRVQGDLQFHTRVSKPGSARPTLALPRGPTDPGQEVKPVEEASDFFEANDHSELFGAPALALSGAAIQGSLRAGGLTVCDRERWTGGPAVEAAPDVGEAGAGGAKGGDGPEGQGPKGETERRHSGTHTTDHPPPLIGLDGAYVRHAFAWTHVRLVGGAPGSGGKGFTVDFRHLQVGEFADTWDSWFRKDGKGTLDPRATWQLEGFRYHTLEAHGGAPQGYRDWRRRLWVQSQETAQPYQQLAEALRRRGEETEARRVLATWQSHWLDRTLGQQWRYPDTVRQFERARELWAGRSSDTGVSRVLYFLLAAAGTLLFAVLETILNPLYTLFRFVSPLIGHGYSVRAIVPLSVLAILLGSLVYAGGCKPEPEHFGAGLLGGEKCHKGVFYPSQLYRYGHLGVDGLHEDSLGYRMSRPQGAPPVESGWVGREEAMAAYPKLIPLLYSADTFIPLIDLHQEEYWYVSSAAIEPEAGPGEAVRDGEEPRWRAFEGLVPDPATFVKLTIWAQVVLGWAFTTILVIAFTGMIRIGGSHHEHHGGHGHKG